MKKFKLFLHRALVWLMIRRDSHYWYCKKCGKISPQKKMLTDSFFILLSCPHCKSGSVESASLPEI